VRAEEKVSLLWYDILTVEMHILLLYFGCNEDKEGICQHSVYLHVSSLNF
jgi:hypothetical protein